MSSGAQRGSTGASDPKQAVAQALGLQSQVANAALMGLWARIPGFTVDDARQAMLSGQLARFWSFRGTVHLHAPEDRALIAAAVGKHQAELTLRWMHRDGLEASEAQDMATQVWGTLRERPMSRHEIAEALASRLSPERVHWITGGWGGVIRLASLCGTVCFDPTVAGGTGFAAVTPVGDDVDTEEARVALLRRYLTAYGPATASDFAYFVGIPATEARKVVLSSDGLVGVVVEDRACLIPDECCDELARSAFDPGEPSVSLLPHFDSYMMGHRDKAPILDPRHSKSVFRQAGWVSPVLLVNGRVAGVWSYKAGERSVAVDVEAFETLSDQVYACVERRILDLGTFLGLQANHVIHPHKRA